MGHGRVFAIRRITAVLPHGRQTMCFFATLEASVAHLVIGSMRDPVRLAFGSTLRPSENVRVPGIRMERVQADTGLAENHDRQQDKMDRAESATKSKLVRLVGASPDTEL
jgi:superfamily II DNA/RNA helicase